MPSYRRGYRNYGRFRTFKRYRGPNQRRYTRAMQRPAYTSSRFRPPYVPLAEHHAKSTTIAEAIPHIAAIPTAGNDIVKIARGSGISERAGSRICVNKVWVKGDVTIDQTSDPRDPASLWIYLIQDTQCNGAAATISSAQTGIWDQSDLGKAFRCGFTYGRYRVLAYRKIQLTREVVYDTIAENLIGARKRKSVSFGWKAKRPSQQIVVEYSQGTTDGALTSRMTNNIFMVWGADENNNNTITSDFEVRCDFWECP